MPRRRRLVLILLLAIGFAPGTWLRSAGPPTDTTQRLLFEALPFPKVRWDSLSVEGAWQLGSSNSLFGGYSAMVSLGDGRLLAGNDRAAMAIFTPPGNHPAPPRIDDYGGFDGRPWGLSDLEALARDPGSGRLWAAYEVDNKLLRSEPDFGANLRIRPAAMRGWKRNGGPEAMTRLSDGRFVVLAEESRAFLGTVRPAVLFADDPANKPAVTRFSFLPPAGYAPTDMGALPDGQVLILLRGFVSGLPWRFSAKLAVADPADIRAGRRWPYRVIADLAPPLPADNYEGLAIEPRPDGSAWLWIISDDNFSVFQRTLLLKLRWSPKQRARESTARP